MTQQNNKQVEDDIRQLKLKVLELDNRLKKMELLVLRQQTNQMIMNKKIRYME